MPGLAPSALSRRQLTELLAEARARTVLLASSLSEEQLHAQPDAAVQPVVRELEQIVRFEQRWLVHGSDSDHTADDSSVAAPVETYDQWFDAMMEVRQGSLDRLEALHEHGIRSLLQYRCGLVLEHEYRRDEAILETLQLQEEPPYRAPRRRTLPRGRRLADPGIMVRFPGGAVPIGAAAYSPTWPDERPEHPVGLEPFWLDVMPVTNGDFLTFLAAGGYITPDFWSEAGWEWVQSAGMQMPRHWLWEGGAWYTRWMDRASPLEVACPAANVSYYEAEAFARFVGKRLPTELEWEAAASWDPETQSRRNFPWGNMPPSPNVANLDQLAFDTAAVGAYPGNVSAIGCYGLIGDLWEWTASDFVPYPGWGEAASTPPLSDQFGTDHKVLRGGSWATRPGAIRVTVRKPASPAARHVFSGFRCARDA